MSVIEFKPQEKTETEIWQCICGSFAFRLYSDAIVECFDCGLKALSMEGYWRTPPHQPIENVVVFSSKPKGESF